MNLYNIVESIYKELEKNKDHLNDLDQAIGDGDHGTNIVRGFKEIIDNKDIFNLPTYKEILNKMAMTLMSKIGGSSGPLLGSFLLQMSMTIGDGKTIQEWAKSFTAGLNGLKMMGKSDVDDKTMIDALTPAIEELNKANDFKKGFELAAKAAQEGADKTVPMLAKKGRASYLGERSVGHMDPGAYSIALIFKAISEAI